MPEYHEKLWPAPWLFLATALVIPASLIVFAPISMTAGIVTAIVLYAGCVVLLLLSAPTLEVKGGSVTCGPAQIDAALLGEAQPFSGAEATQERGPRLDARAWLLLRGWVQPVVRIPLLDPEDPAPYWLVSTRHPQKLAAAINGSRRPVPGS
jgi:hypothetical protein